MNIQPLSTNNKQALQAQYEKLRAIAGNEPVTEAHQTDLVSLKSDDAKEFQSISVFGQQATLSKLTSQLTVDKPKSDATIPIGKWAISKHLTKFVPSRVLTVATEFEGTTPAQKPGDAASQVSGKTSAYFLEGKLSSFLPWKNGKQAIICGSSEQASQAGTGGKIDANNNTGVTFIQM